MRTYIIKADVYGNVAIRDPRDPIYTIDTLYKIDVECYVTAKDEARARKLVEEYDYTVEEDFDPITKVLIGSVLDVTDSTDGDEPEETVFDVWYGHEEPVCYD